MMAAAVILLAPRIRAREWDAELARLAAMRAAAAPDPSDDDWSDEWDSRDSNAYQDQEESR